MDACIRQKVLEATRTLPGTRKRQGSAVLSGAVIELSSSSSSSSSDSSSDSDSDNDLDSVIGNVVSQAEMNTDGVSVGVNGGMSKRRKADDMGLVVPVRFLSRLPPEAPPSLPQFPPAGVPVASGPSNEQADRQSCKQFWKAGDYEGGSHGDWDSSSVGMDHVRVHPKFLHSNATSHKWALGAFAELLDNSLDEVCNGATYVNVDMLVNRRDGTRMLLIEDNGGGMDPDKMRQCMSLGYSVKSKLANTIGQYGNGFKTSTMRLGADVIVFSRCPGKDGKSSTQSIGLLSYTFLRSTQKEDIVVPMLDYERRGGEWNKMIRSSCANWDANVETIVQWSPFSSETDLLRQFNMMRAHGTRIIIYNLWEDDQRQLELDFDADPNDIQIRGVNRDEKNIQMAKEYPNSGHFLTYRHSLRSYASILYLRFPLGFRIILRGKDVVHHNIVNDMMMSQELTYRPQAGADGIPKDLNMVALVTVGFVKDAVHHVDVSGFNVYHKNRLIKPFWRIWNPAGCNGRGVIGVLEANFVEPAHDKQGFERTIVLSRLESRLVQMQKNYWAENCHKIGYVSNRSKKQADDSNDRDASSDCVLQSSRSKRKYSAESSKGSLSAPGKLNSRLNRKHVGKESERHDEDQNGQMSASPRRNGRLQTLSEPSTSAEEVDDEIHGVPHKTQVNASSRKTSVEKSYARDGGRRTQRTMTESVPKEKEVDNDSDRPLSNFDLLTLEQLKEENRQLKERLERMEGENLAELLKDLQHERDKCRLLETELEDKDQKIAKLTTEQDTIIDIFSEERGRREAEEKNLRWKLQEASNTIQELLEKVRLLERR